MLNKPDDRIFKKLFLNNLRPLEFYTKNIIMDITIIVIKYLLHTKIPALILQRVWNVNWPNSTSNIIRVEDSLTQHIFYKAYYIWRILCKSMTLLFVNEFAKKHSRNSTESNFGTHLNQFIIHLFSLVARAPTFENGRIINLINLIYEQLLFSSGARND